MYTARVWKNTGFNSVNIPDKPATLGNTYLDFPIMDILQNLYLSSISIKLNPTGMNAGSAKHRGFADIQQADYLAIISDDSGSGRYHVQTAYYSINSVEMTSADVAKLHITMDSFLTMGGVDGLQVVSGITERRNITDAENIFGYYTEEDPFLNPTQPLIAEYGCDAASADFVNSGYCKYGVFFQDPEYTIGNGYNYEHKSLVRSALDLTNSGNFLQFDTQYLTENSPVPYVKSLSNSDTGKPEMGLPGPIVSVTGTTTLVPDGELNTYKEPGVKYFDGNTNSVLENIQIARSLGIENAITASWKIPSNLFVINGSPSPTSIMSKTRYANLGNFRGTNGIYRYIYSTSPHYLRTMTGALNKFVMVSIATGSSTEANPEDLMPDSMLLPKTDLAGNTMGPLIMNVGDPRPEGKPYFNFLRLRNKNLVPGTNPTRNVNFYENCVEGMTWLESPILYDSNRGNMIYQTRYSANQANKDFWSAPQILAAFNGQGVTSSLGNFATGAASGNALAAGTGAVFGSGFGKYATYQAAYDVIAKNNVGDSEYDNNLSLAMGGNKIAQAQVQRQFERNLENIELTLNTQVIEPSVAFPQNQSLRDCVGNGVLVYRLRPTDADLARFDKILARFGHKISEPFVKAHMTNSAENWNYLKVQGATFKPVSTGYTQAGNHRMLDDITMLFSGGVRIWHTLPSQQT